MQNDIYSSERQSPARDRLFRDYTRISSECAMVTATDSRHAPYLFNAMVSIHSRFTHHPVLHVFDLGMNNRQKQEIADVPWARLRATDHFAPHWKLNWSWKPYILTQVPQRYVFYFDASNIVLYRSLMLWFTTIAKKGYFLIKNGQTLRQSTPPDYWKLFDCNEHLFADAPSFGAGLMGFDREGIANQAINEVLARTVEGWNLGRSALETRPVYDRSVIRDCECFRADQTLFNLAFRKHYGSGLLLRDELRYCGLGGPADHPRQYLWYARRKRESLVYFWRPLGKGGVRFFANRIATYIYILARDHGVRLWQFGSRIIRRLRRTAAPS